MRSETPLWTCLLVFVLPGAAIGAAYGALDARSGERQPDAKRGAVVGALGGALLCLGFSTGYQLVKSR